ncbi:MAG: type IV pilin protein [Fluviicoccus sp.]|uniref:type IV pilin protein n=1 Tax=Fluviicoccus sp. TaxID=2003552 RepID=UPI0027170BCB|nr:type IV pilin protein [Fluviicoccus sp.]MDO8331472.1 type IV pilin protein [Fluviicoccus sp.]
MKKNKGFTLMEIMAVVTILAILVAVAVPSYRQYVTKGNRTGAQAEMMQIASALERYKALQMTYTNATLAAGPGSVYGSSVYPKDATGSRVLYDLSFTVAPSTTWELRAVPNAGGPQKGNGALFLNSAGQTCWSQSGAATCTYGTDRAW